MHITFKQLSKVAESEHTMRNRVYPGLIIKKKIYQAEADFQLLAMQQIAEFLLYCAEHEPRSLFERWKKHQAAQISKAERERRSGTTNDNEDQK